MKTISATIAAAGATIIMLSMLTAAFEISADESARKTLAEDAAKKLSAQASAGDSSSAVSLHSARQ